MKSSDKNSANHQLLKILHQGNISKLLVTFLSNLSLQH